MTIFISTTSPTASFKESKLEQAITQMAVKLAKERSTGSLPQGPSLDINFLVPGKYEKPDFTGMRMGNYDEEQTTLYFERFVPDRLLESDEAEEFVKLVLEDVVDNAASFFAEHKVNFDIKSWQRTLSTLN